MGPLLFAAASLSRLVEKPARVTTESRATAPAASEQTHGSSIGPAHSCSLLGTGFSEPSPRTYPEKQPEPTALRAPFQCRFLSIWSQFSRRCLNGPSRITLRADTESGLCPKRASAPVLRQLRPVWASLRSSGAADRDQIFTQRSKGAGQGERTAGACWLGMASTGLHLHLTAPLLWRYRKNAAFVSGHSSANKLLYQVGSIYA